jgi:hypothetical protein
MAVGYEIDQPSATTPLSPRVSDVSNGSRYMRENDFLESPIRSPASVVSMWSEGKRKMNGKLRHAIGIALLLATVFLWTTSNFLASVSHVKSHRRDEVLTYACRRYSQTIPTPSHILLRTSTRPSSSYP